MYRQWRRHMSRLLWQRRGFALVIFNFDRLLSLNAYAGHSKGDRAMKEVAYEVLRALPKEGRVYWLAGDLAVLLPGMNEQQAYAWAEVVRKTIEAEVDVVGETGPRSLTVRAGVTEHLPARRLWSKRDQRPLVMAAEAALVEARARGGNCVVKRPVVALLESEQWAPNRPR
jgi:diguanylate cyclase (GGDEF)-like protein